MESKGAKERKRPDENATDRKRTEVWKIRNEERKNEAEKTGRDSTTSSCASNMSATQNRKNISEMRNSFASRHLLHLLFMLSTRAKVEHQSPGSKISSWSRKMKNTDWIANSSANTSPSYLIFGGWVDGTDLFSCWEATLLTKQNWKGLLLKQRKEEQKKKLE